MDEVKNYRMSIEYIPIKDAVKYLPHEKTNKREVDSIVRRLRKKPLIRPISVWEDIVLDGHHRWNAVKFLYENVRGWKTKQIPICFLSGFSSSGATLQEIINAANSGNLLGYKTTHTTPRSPDVKFKIK